MFTKDEASAVLDVLDCGDMWTSADDIGVDAKVLQSAVKKLEKLAEIEASTDGVTTP